MPRHDRLRSFLLVDLVPAVAVLTGGMALGAGVASAAQSLTTDTAVARMSCVDDGRAVGTAVSGVESAVLAGGLAGADRGGCAGGGSGAAAAALAGGVGAGGPAVDLDGHVGVAGRHLDDGWTGDTRHDGGEPDGDEPEPEPEPGPGTEAVWDRLAQCESAGNWSIDTGNGYFGGLQFDVPTWRDYDGTEFAPRADRATRAEQIEVATRVRDDRGGYGSWPACSAQLGLPR